MRYTPDEMIISRTSNGFVLDMLCESEHSLDEDGRKYNYTTRIVFENEEDTRYLKTLKRVLEHIANLYQKNVPEFDTQRICIELMDIDAYKEIEP